MNKIIYLHIRKCAGSSFRELMKKNYGYNNVIWDHKPTGNIKKHLDDNKILGGHFSFKDVDNEYDSDDILFLSSVRSPIERIISLFNYHVFSDSWVGKVEGFNENSLSKTINDCRLFKELIANNQCYSLSGSYSFSDTIKLISNKKFIVGLQNHQDYFSNTLGEKLSWPSKTPFQTNRSKGHNPKSLVLKDSDIELIFNICSEDYKLYEYIKATGSIFISEKAKNLSHTHFSLKTEDEVIEHEKVFINSKDKTITTNKKKEQPFKLKIENNSRKNLLCHEKSINLSYHITDKDGNMLVYNGLRTKLPEKINGDSFIDTLARVDLPKTKGEYKLYFSLVQEGVCWFDEVNKNHCEPINLIIK